MKALSSASIVRPWAHLCRKSAAKKARSPVPLWIQFPEGNRGTILFGGLHAKPVTSLLRTLRAYARSQGFWLQAAAAWGSSDGGCVSERGAPPPQAVPSSLIWGGKAGGATPPLQFLSAIPILADPLLLGGGFAGTFERRGKRKIYSPLGL